jgi:hypothetical protein
MGVTLLSQAGRRALDEAYFLPRESGSCDAGLRRASSRPHSKTLSRGLGAAMHVLNRVPFLPGSF